MTSKLVGLTDSLSSGIKNATQKLGIKDLSSLRNIFKNRASKRRNSSKSPQTTKTQNRPNQSTQSGNSHGNNQTGNTGQANGQSKPPCPNCPTTIKPVNPIQGVKVLSGKDDTDFILTGDLPLVWDRQYVSDSTVGRGRAGDAIGWYGQGWGNTWTLCLNVRPSEDLVQLIDAYGREINFPYIAIGSSFYSRYEDIRLHHDAQGQYRLTAGTSETGDGIALHFGEAEADNLLYPRYTTYYCTGQSDSYGNRITLSYHQHADKAHLPQYIQDSVGRLIQLEFTPFKDTEHYRLVQINELINLSHTALQQLPTNVQQTFATLNIAQYQDYAKQLIADNKAPTALIATKPLVSYRYSEQGDLTEVYRYQDLPNDQQTNNPQTISPSRRYEWRNHIMIAHHFADGISSYYKYNKHTITGKVIENRINNGQTYHFDYHDGYTIVTQAKDTPNESQTIYHFNEELRWTGITDGNGNHTQFILDSFGRLIEQIDPDGHTQTFSYAGDNLTAINQLIDIDPVSRQPLWRTQQYTYQQGKLSNLIDPLGNSTHIQYDEHGQPTVITDANGHSTHIERDNKGRVIRQTLANGSSYIYEYDLVGNLTQQTDCSGYTTHYQYDDMGRLTQVTDPMGQTTHYRYDTADYRTASPVQIHYPDGTQEQFAYDRQGRLLTHSDAKGQSTHYQYEIDDLPKQRTDALGHTLTYHYDNQRRLIRLTNENGEDWTFTYDNADNLISETRFDGTTAHYDYSKAGLLKHQLDTGLHHYYRYDRAGQLTDKYSLTDRQYLTKVYAQIDKTNPFHHTEADYHRYQQPLFGKNSPHRLRYQYDLAGQLIRAISPDATTQLAYDPVGQLIQETLYRHHSHAELAENETDSHSTLSQTLTHEYDELGNRIKTTLPDGKALNQLYYGSGHLYNQSLTDEQGNIFDIRHSTTNPLHQEVTRQQGELLSSFGYDPMGRLTKQYSSNDKHIVIERDYAYDKVGQLTHIASKTRLTQLIPNKPTQTVVNHYQRNHQYGYDRIGRLVSHRLSDYQHHAGVQERFAFDPASNRVPLPSDSGQSSQAISQPSSQIDTKTKRPTSLITQGKKIGYVYDKHGRVQFKTIVPVDKDGEALKQSSQSIVGYLESLQLFYNTNNELEKSINIHQQGFEVTITTTRYFYDAFGRRVGKSSEVQQASKLNQRGKLVRFPENLVNLRISEKSQRQSMLMLWDGNRQIQEYTKDHVFTTVYEQDSFVPVARIVQLSAQNEKQRVADGVAHVRRYVSSGIITQEVLDNIEKAKIPLVKIYHYHCNHLGTPQELSDEKGDIVWLSYDRAWGESFDKFYKSQFIDNYEILAEQLQPIKFQGQMLDIETGLHYNRFRYYDSDVGMFISRDPIGLLGGNNTFQYAPNPIEWIDPLGLSTSCKNCNPVQQDDCDAILKKEKVVIGKHRYIKKIGGEYDSHHIYQDAAVNNISKYKYNDAIAISIKGRNIDGTTKGTSHYLANRAQDSSSKAGILGGETVVAYNSLRAAGLSPKAAKCATLKARSYLSGLGATSGTTTNQLSRRKGK
ncbi:RHS repeat-associated core domain-containing protein [Faucicola atlantae]|uniref:RHS repeat-associated core domain-containing protein n=1 Tax=Faucicola atlantae TaxID=34059 RepID=UPI0025B034A6|nr:RHS repeat-associated core domain-containing protein [Moraxella atlantae]